MASLPQAAKVADKQIKNNAFVKKFRANNDVHAGDNEKASQLAGNLVYCKIGQKDYGHGHFFNKEPVVIKH